MINWWSDLSPREQTLIGIAGVLAFVLFVSFFVLRPLGDWRENADRRAESARNTYELVATAAAQSSGASAPAPQSNVPLRQAVTAAAADWEVVLVRFGAETNGQIEVQPEPTEGDKLFGWLEALQTQYGVRVAFADMSRAEEGNVNAQVLVLERPQ